MEAKLKVGDKVSWRGCWGADSPEIARVEIIEINCEEKYGQPVTNVEWSEVNSRNVVVTLDNGHWAYGTQISRI